MCFNFVFGKINLLNLLLFHEMLDWCGHGQIKLKIFDL